MGQPVVEEKGIGQWDNGNGSGVAIDLLDNRPPPLERLDLGLVDPNKNGIKYTTLNWDEQYRLQPARYSCSTLTDELITQNLN